MIINFVRAIIIYVIVLIVMRLMGKREIGQLQPFELVISIMIADLASIPMSDPGVPIFNGIVPILGLLCMHLIITVLNIKSVNIRKVTCGKPTILIYIYISIVGFPQVTFLIFTDFIFNTVIIKCIHNNPNIGTIPLNIGTPGSDIGIDAKSAIIIEITSSKGWSCPISLFPINLITIKTITYIIIALTKLIIIYPPICFSIYIIWF